jgi:hypothetical protein
MKVKTLEEALEFVHSAGICTLFIGKAKIAPSLCDAVDLPEEGGGQTKWGAKVEAIWAWKNELPEMYPDDLYYGKAHRPVKACSTLAQEVYEMIRIGSETTGILRKEAKARFVCTKSQFDTALKQLQVTLNISWSNEPGIAKNTWITFNEASLHLLGDEDSN